MKTIWKYKLEPKELVKIKLPLGFKILKVDEQDGEIVFWAAVDTKHPTEEVSFAVFGTGHDLGETGLMEYQGAVSMESGLVWHVFRKL